jgi:hypothetical protein
MNGRALCIRLWVLAFAAPCALRGQAARDSMCYYMDRPGVSHSFALDAGYRIEITRIADTDAVEYGCTATVRNARGTVVWHGSGFGASLTAWTGRDIDNDGHGDAIVGIDTGGGNKCCWGYTVLRLIPKFEVMVELPFAPFFDRDAHGRTLIREFMAFYDLGTASAESPVAIQVHQFRSGKLVDVTREQCLQILTDTVRRIGSLAWDRDDATPPALAVSRRATEDADHTFEIDRTRSAVMSIAMQYIVCGQPAQAATWINDAWPAADAPARFDMLLSAWAHRQAAPKR